MAILLHLNKHLERHIQEKHIRRKQIRRRRMMETIPLLTQKRHNLKPKKQKHPNPKKRHPQRQRHSQQRKHHQTLSLLQLMKIPILNLTLLHLIGKHNGMLQPKRHRNLWTKPLRPMETLSSKLDKWQWESSLPLLLELFALFCLSFFAAFGAAEERMIM